MIILVAILTASLLVFAQSLWKSAIDGQLSGVALNLNFMLSGEFLKLIFSLKILVGVVIYGLATLVFFYALSKYNYFQVQSVVVGSSIVLTFLLARFYFGEDIKLINVIGIFLIIVGSVLVIKH